MSGDLPEWLRETGSDPATVGPIYDDWAGGYDRDLAAWGYEVPRWVARQLADIQPGAEPILDAGCGAGLVGRAAIGRVRHDRRSRPLGPVARTGRSDRAYRSLHQVDFQRPPTPFEDDAFAALVCVGVMTYLPDRGLADIGAIVACLRAAPV